VRAGIDFEGAELVGVAGLASDVVADFLDRGSDDRRGVLGMAEFQVHAAADILQLEHGASPGGTGDGDLYGLRAELGMAGQQGFAAAEHDGGVAVVHGLDLKDGGRGKIVQENATLDFRLDNAAVYLVREIGVGAEHTGPRVLG
jgi:hypothetical protein